MFADDYRVWIAEMLVTIPGSIVVAFSHATWLLWVLILLSRKIAKPAGSFRLERRESASL
jgi:hypothetical protein